MPAAEARLYAIDCGRMLTNGVDASNPCFLIRHPAGDLLWDTGVPQSFADAPGGVTNVGKVKITVETKLTDSLAQIGLKPQDIEFLAVSHSHFDHMGNANVFAASTWIVDIDEHAWAFRPAARSQPGFASYRELQSAPVQKIEGDGDLDVFGDGTVVIVQAPGHTPGHIVLLLKLRHAGAVLLAGDLWNTKESRGTPRGTPEELASIGKIEALISATKARVVRQHVSDDFVELPRFPNFLN